MLKNNKNIVIKKEGKGSAVVVMNTTDYLREGYRQLSDQKFYQLRETDKTEKHSKNIAEVLTQMRSLNLITQKKILSI